MWQRFLFCVLLTTGEREGEEEGEGEEEAGRSERGVVATSLVLPTAPGTSGEGGGGGERGEGGRGEGGRIRERLHTLQRVQMYCVCFCTAWLAVLA